MEPAPTCPRCGRENDPSFAFCHDCGQALRADGEPDLRPLRREAAGLLPLLRALRPGRRGAAPPRRPTHPVVPARSTPPPERPVAGPPAAGAPARLVLVRHDGLPGAAHALDREVTVCGRRDGDLLLPEDGSVSPRHAAITVREGRIRVEDLGIDLRDLPAAAHARARSPSATRSGWGGSSSGSSPCPGRGDRRPSGTPWGSADPGYRARLVQLLEGGGLGEVIPLRAGANAIGTGERRGEPSRATATSRGATPASTWARRR